MPNPRPEPPDSPGGRTLDPDRPTPDPDRGQPETAAGSPEPEGSPAPSPAGSSATPGPGATASASGPTPGATTGSRSGPAAGGRREPPPNLRDQVRTTVDAARGVVDAHVALAKAEAEGIKYEIGRAVGLGAFAIACLVLLALFLPIGLLLFFGEALFGSMGWGVLLGTELLVASAVFAVLVAVRLPAARLGVSIGIAFLVGLVVFAVCSSHILNTIYRTIGELFPAGTDPGDIVLGYGAGIGAAVGALIGLIAGVRTRDWRRAIGGLFAGAIGGAILGLLGAWLVRLAIDPGSRPMIVGMLIWGLPGAVGGAIALRQSGWRVAATGASAGLVGCGLFGAFTAITFAWNVAIAIGLAVLFGVAPAAAAASAADEGIDTEALKARFIPQVTIETAKETLEWTKSRIPFGPKP